MAFGETWHKYLLREWELLKTLSRSKVKGQKSKVKVKVKVKTRPNAIMADACIRRRDAEDLLLLYNTSRSSSWSLCWVLYWRRWPQIRISIKAKQNFWPGRKLKLTYLNNPWQFHNLLVIRDWWHITFPFSWERETESRLSFSLQTYRIVLYSVFSCGPWVTQIQRANDSNASICNRANHIFDKAVRIRSSTRSSRPILHWYRK